MIVELEYCEELDELVLPLSDELMKGAGLKLGDEVEWINNHDGSWTLRKKQMSKFTFTCTIEDRVNTLSFEAESHDMVIANMTDFLRGCGYIFDGYLDIVPDEFAPTYTANFEVSTVEDNSADVHNEHYYDTERNK
jgi:hypothetical protein